MSKQGPFYETWKYFFLNSVKPDAVQKDNKKPKPIIININLPANMDKL